MSLEINNRKDLLLLLLYSPGVSDKVNEPISGRTRLVKMLFLMKKELLPHLQAGIKIDVKSFYEFFGWNFGPFSVDAYDDIAFFTLRDFIESTDDDKEGDTPESALEIKKWLGERGADIEDPAVTDYAGECFRLTGKGTDFVKKLYAILTGRQRTALKEFKKRLNSASLGAILSYVYTQYPDYTDKSKIKERVLGSSA